MVAQPNFRLSVEARFAEDTGRDRGSIEYASDTEVTTQLKTRAEMEALPAAIDFLQARTLFLDTKPSDL